MKRMVEFFDRLEERLENNIENKSRMKKGMGMYTEKQVGGDFLIVSFDLPMLFGRIFGFDTSLCCAIVAILSFIPGEICIHYLNKRIEAQETEEMKEDLKDDISRTSLIALVIAGIVFCILGLLMVWERQNKWL